MEIMEIPQIIEILETLVKTLLKHRLSEIGISRGVHKDLGTGSARFAQMRVFSFEFFAKHYCFTQGENICNGKNKGLATPCVNEEQNASVLVFDFRTKTKNKIGASQLFPFGLPFSTPFSILWNVKQDCRT